MVGSETPLHDVVYNNGCVVRTGTHIVRLTEHVTSGYLLTKHRCYTCSPVHKHTRHKFSHTLANIHNIKLFLKLFHRVKKRATILLLDLVAVVVVVVVQEKEKERRRKRS